jgi:hypothetical protein
MYIGVGGLYYIFFIIRIFQIPLKSLKDVKRSIIPNGSLLKSLATNTANKL